MKWQKRSNKVCVISVIFRARAGFSADGFTLLPSALRPGLACAIGMALVLLFSSLIGLGMSNGDASATSLTLTIPDAPVSLDLVPAADGTFAKSNGNTVGVKSDASFGYTLTILGKSDNNSLLNSGDQIASIGSSVTEETFRTSAEYINRWGYQPSKINSLANDDFLAGPTNTDSATIDKTSGVNGGVTNYTITIAAKINNAISSGQYSNGFTISAVANSVNYSIRYNLNSGSGGPDTNPQTGNTTESSVALSSITPSRSGYTFLGWCNVETTNESCNGITYQPGNNYPLVNGANNIELYAMWQSTVPTTMQNFDSYCSALAEHQSISLTDTRDNTTYTAAKLKDGHCWMTKNLRIANTTITPDDSDVSSSYRIAASSTSGFSSSTSQSVYVHSTIGGIYSWNTAVAGNGVSSGEAPYSICAKGWRLPSIDEYRTLASYYGQNSSGQLYQSPLNFSNNAGYCQSSDCSEVGRTAWSEYWSSTANGSSQAYGVNIYSNSFNVDSSNGAGKGCGFAVRCVSRK